MMYFDQKINAFSVILYIYIYIKKEKYPIFCSVFFAFLHIYFHNLTFRK